MKTGVFGFWKCIWYIQKLDVFVYVGKTGTAL